MKNKLIVILILVLSIQLHSLPNAFGLDHVNNATIVKLYTYKNLRTAIKLDTPISNADGCTYNSGGDQYFVGLTVNESGEVENTAVEEMYASLLGARLTNTKVGILVSGCIDYGGGTIPRVIRVDL